MPEPPFVELSVILPAFNEESAVAGAVETYLRSLGECCASFELVVIDDGSADDTFAAAERAAAGHPAVRVLRNERNLGQVATILRGWAESRGEFVMHNGIDLPFDPGDTGTVLARLRDGADVVVVERVGRQAYGAARKLLSWANVSLVRMLFGSPFVDHNFVQAFRRRALQGIAVESRGVSTVTTELILKSLAAGFRVESVAAPYHARASGRSSLTFKKIVHTVSELFRLRRIMRRSTRN
ncbi:MAG TPA: glycosyltransferase family 2 protein [Pirellulales bacterium]|nr:glycosyltransferase family 2 protein [Pirellulales bacterium]